MLWSVVIPFLVYWLVLFVTCYVAVEFSQTYLYDETTPAVALKVGIGTLIFAALLTWTRTGFHSVLTEDLGRSVFLAVVWFAVFVLLFRFHPVHGFAIGVIAFVLLSGLSTLAVDSLTRPRPVSSGSARPTGPIRRAVGPRLNGPEEPPKDSPEAELSTP